MSKMYLVRLKEDHEETVEMIPFDQFMEKLSKDLEDVAGDCTPAVKKHIEYLTKFSPEYEPSNSDNYFGKKHAKRNTSKAYLFLHSYVQYIEKGFYPPKEIIEWLAKGFKAFLQANDKNEVRQLNDIFELTPSPGRALPSTQVTQERFESGIALDILILTKMGVKESLAKQAVLEKLDHAGSNYAYNRITKIFKEHQQSLQDYLKQYGEINYDDFLGTFPDNKKSNEVRCFWKKVKKT